MVDSAAVISEGLNVVPDTATVIRLINKGYVLSCSTTVVSVLKQPINVIVLEFPTRYERMQIRKHPRLEICLPALFNDLNAPTPEAKNIRHKATAVDISISGALVASKQKLAVSQRIALSIKLSSMDKVTNLISIVKNLPEDKRVGNETYYMAGVEFQNLSEESKEKLMKFIEANRPFRT